MAESYAPFVNVIGRVTKDPFVKTVKDTEVVVFSVSKRTGFKSDGEQYDPSDFFDVEVWDTERDWGHRQFLAAQSLRKGQRVGIESSAPKERQVGDRTYRTLRPWGLWRIIDLEVEGDDDDSI